MQSRDLSIRILNIQIRPAVDERKDLYFFHRRPGVRLSCLAQFNFEFIR